MTARPVVLEGDELAAIVAALRFLRAVDGGLDGPQRRALSKVELAHELAVTAPSLRTAVVEGELAVVHDTVAVLGAEGPVMLDSIASIAGVRCSLDEERGVWSFGRVRITLEALPARARA